MKRIGDTLGTIRAGFVWVLLLPLRFYSRVISPALPARCRYYPTCSAYAEQAVRRHGVLKGGALAAWRLVRCNPFSRGGVDEVPPPGRWRPDPASTTPPSRDDAHTHGSHA